MPVTIPSAALRQMSETERTRLLDAAFAHSPDALAGGDHTQKHGKR
jgi:hypothetical protein